MTSDLYQWPIGQPALVLKNNIWHIYQTSTFLSPAMRPWPAACMQSVTHRYFQNKQPSNKKLSKLHILKIAAECFVFDRLLSLLSLKNSMVYSLRIWKGR